MIDPDRRSLLRPSRSGRCRSRRRRPGRRRRPRGGAGGAERLPADAGDRPRGRTTSTRIWCGADITEGLPGAPLALVLQVVDAECRPIEGARVDVWHCDAAGNYSGYARQGSDRTRDTRGETFMRGTQFADARGVAAFRTIWPGWYRGRTPHVHYKVFLDEATLLTSQLFFPDGASEAVFRGAPTATAPGRRTPTNANDGIARRAGPRAFARVAQADARLAGGARRRRGAGRPVGPRRAPKLEARRQPTSSASSVISIELFRSLEIGQISLAFCAAWVKVSTVIPGTFARTVR